LKQRFNPVQHGATFEVSKLLRATLSLVTRMFLLAQDRFTPLSTVPPSTRGTEGAFI